jgi:hypothetical protein
MVTDRNSYNVLTGEPKGNSSLGGPKHRWRIILKTILNKNTMC